MLVEVSTTMSSLQREYQPLREEIKETEIKTDSSDCREVGVFISVYRLSNIDIVNQTFAAEFELELTWLCTKGRCYQI